MGAVPTLGANKEFDMKKLVDMTDIGYKRTMTKIQKRDDIIREAAKILKCKPEDILERTKKLIDDIEELEVKIKEVKDKL